MHDPYADPDAPVGPEPAFAVTSMQRLAKDQRAFPDHHAARGAPNAADRGSAKNPAGSAQVARPDPAPFPEPAEARSRDRRA